MFRQASRAVFLAFAVLAASGTSLADHHEVGEVEAAVKQFYSQLSSGQFKEAMGHVAIGGNGYVAEGVLMAIDSEEVRQGIVKLLQDGAERGAEMDLRPQDIKVVIHGNTAIATYLIDAKTKQADDDEAKEQVNRGSLVWAKTDDGWKIVHWHVSELVPDEN